MAVAAAFPKGFIRTLRLQNFLSYGEAATEIELASLNVLIGPNASGKSNLIEAMALLRATPGDLAQFIRAGGGIEEWLWKGGRKTPTAQIDITVQASSARDIDLHYKLAFTASAHRLELVDEAVENAQPSSPRETDVFFYYRYQLGRPTLSVRTTTSDLLSSEIGRANRSLRREDYP